MPGKKEKPRSRDRSAAKGGASGAGGGGLAAMLGLGMDPGLDITDDAELEAELLALEGKSPGKKGKSSSKKGVMSMAEVDKMMAGLGNIGDDNDDDDDDVDVDEDDEELLGELKALEDSGEVEEETPPPPSPPKKASPAPRKSKSSSSSGGGSSTAEGVVSEVSERMKMYQQAIQQADAAGESSKVRRYKRSMTSLEQMLKTAKAGRPVNLEEMPPPVNVKDQPTASSSAANSKAPPPSSKPPPKSKPPPNLINLDDPEFDEFNISEEEMASLAATMKDDRVQPQAKVAETGDKTKPSPKQPAVGMVTAPSTDSVKPIPKPRAKPAPKPPKMAPGGMIDLDDPEFDEFNLTDEEIAAMAASMVDDRESKKPKLEDPSPSQSIPQPEIPSSSLSRAPLRPTPNAPQSRAPVRPTPNVPQRPPQAPEAKSLPATLSKPVGDTSDKATLRAMLIERRDQYQAAAKAAKEPTKNREYRLIAAKFVRVIKATDAGEPLDLSQMPGPPPGYRSRFNIDISKFTTAAAAVQSPTTSLSTTKPHPPPSQAGSTSEAAGSTEESEATPNPDIPIPKTALEALEQRLAKYKEGQQSAQEKGESSRVRRMGRIIKQYEGAIRDVKTGKPHDFDDLPCPPGFPPIPAAGRGRPARPGVPLPTQSLPASRSQGPVAGPSGPAPTPSISQEQITFVEKRMTELKMAAKQEQAKGDKEKALHYVKMMKGLESMLTAAKGGLPVNLQQVPPSPFADISKTAPSTSVMSHLRPAEEKDAATFELIMKQLEKQIAICQRNAETYKKIGSNASAIEYENMSQNCEKELLALKGIQTRGYGPPKFTLEVRKLTIVHSNTHLSSSVCEVEVTRVLDIPCPPKYEEKDMNIYIETEFPYPADAPPKKSTNCVSKTCSPEFKDQPLIFDIDRKHHRTLVRAFKRTPLKLTLWQRRSLKRDIFLGIVNVQLEGLESRSEVHATVDLLDERGRKPVGGKMEVCVRLREPITGRDVEENDEQWLVFQESIAEKSAIPMPKLTTSPKKQAAGGGASGGPPNYALLSPVKVEATTSVAALRVEFSLATSAIKAGHKDAHTVQKAKLIKTRLEALQQKLQSDPKFRQAYPMQVAKEMQGEKQLEAQLVKQGKGKQAEVVIIQKRRTAMEKELLEMKKK